MHCGYQKTQNLMLILNPLEKLQKIHTKKFSTQKWQKSGVFDFYYYVKKLSAYNLFWAIFCIFCNDLNSASNFMFYDTHFKFLPKNCVFIFALFANFKATRGQNGPKKLRKYIINVS